MTWGATAVAATTVVGSYLSSQANKSAAQTSADAQRYAADQAAAAARFKPVGITTRFGQSAFTYGGQPTTSAYQAPPGYSFTAPQGGMYTMDMPPEGQQWAYNQQTGERIAVPTTQTTSSPYGPEDLSGASYTLSPELKAIQDRVMFGIKNYDPSQYQQASQGMFNLGQKYLATSPEEAAAKYAEQQRALLAPGRETALAALRNQQYTSGRSGLGIASGQGLAATNPEAAAYYNALAQQEKEIAMNADLYGRDRVNYGVGLMLNAPQMFNAGYSPLATGLGLSSQIEGMGQQALALSSELAGRQSTAGANAGQFLYSGGLNAARTQQMANQYSLPGATLTAFGTSPQASAWFDKLINRNTTGLSYNPGTGYGTATGYQSWNTSNPELVQTQQTYGV